MDFFTEDGQQLPEQPIADYALAHGLTINSSINASLQLASACPDDHVMDSTILAEDSLPPLEFGNVEISLIEKPTISKSSLELLSRIHHRESIDHITEPFYSNPQIRLRAKRMELPLLCTDPDIDCVRLFKRIQEAKVVRMDAALPPVEPLNESCDESLAFPSSAHAFHQNILATLKTERIAVPKTSIDYFGHALQENWTSTDTEGMFDELVVHRSCRVRKLSLPLSPVSQHGEYFIPDSAGCQVPISSDPSSLLDADLKTAEAALEEDGSPDPEPLTSFFSPMNEASFEEINDRKRKDLKLEEPLMSMDSEATAPDQSLDVGRAFADITDSPLASDSDSDCCLGLDGLLSNDLLETFEASMEALDRTVEQEQPESKGALARLPVPVMDFSLPEPEWTIDWSHPRQNFELIMKGPIGHPIRMWPDDPASWRQLRWFPFSSKHGEINHNETIEAPDLKHLLEFPDPSSVATSSDYVWKQPGLSILSRDDDYDDILDDVIARLSRKTMSDSSASSDLQILARKRIQETTNSSSSPLLAPKTDPKQETAKRMLVEANDPSASTTLLYNFLGFNNAKRRKLGESSFFSKKVEPEVTVPSKHAEDPSTLLTQVENTHEPSIIPPKPGPFPTLKAEGVPATIITSIALSRGIVAVLDQLMPHLKTIERDFNRWNMVDWGRNSVVRAPVSSSLAMEADVIVSPATGIVITTLLNVMQRPLPGQIGKAAVREKIERVSSRYERLIVLVSQGNRRDEGLRELVKHECEAYSEFSGFLTSLGTENQVHYVGGGEDTLSYWLAYFIARYSAEAMKVDDLLIDQETTWEIILRRAGMNAFAAQIVLSIMKHREVPEGDVVHCGLAGFVAMSPPDRFAVFSQYLGGVKVLQRVGAVLDAPW